MNMEITMSEVQRNNPASTNIAPAKRSAREYTGEITALLRNRGFYLGVFTLLLGIQVNFVSQQYLHEYTTEVKALPVLSDLILDNLPYLDISYLYDIFSLLALFVFCGYVFHRKQFSNVPYYLLLCGIFHVIRGVFIVLTPFGNPPMFNGTDGLFNGFSQFEIGVYPSGHTGINFLYCLLAVDKRYRRLLLTCLVIVVAALFLSRGHYSIDVLSGLLFAYAIKAFGDKYLLKWITIEERSSVENPCVP